MTPLFNFIYYLVQLIKFGFCFEGKYYIDSKFRSEKSYNNFYVMINFILFIVLIIEIFIVIIY